MNLYAIIKDMWASGMTVKEIADWFDLQVYQVIDILRNDTAS